MILWARRRAREGSSAGSGYGADRGVFQRGAGEIAGSDCAGDGLHGGRASVSDCGAARGRKVRGRLEGSEVKKDQKLREVQKRMTLWGPTRRPQGRGRGGRGGLAHRGEGGEHEEGDLDFAGGDKFAEYDGHKNLLILFASSEGVNSKTRATPAPAFSCPVPQICKLCGLRALRWRPDTSWGGASVGACCRFGHIVLLLWPRRCGNATVEARNAAGGCLDYRVRESCGRSGCRIPAWGAYDPVIVMERHYGI